MVAVTAPEDAERIAQRLAEHGETVAVIGEIVPHDGPRQSLIHHMAEKWRG
jgi:phosphoribosylaminoimidazole (AIR) synthetase